MFIILNQFQLIDKKVCKIRISKCRK